MDRSKRAPAVVVAEEPPTAIAIAVGGLFGLVGLFGLAWVSLAIVRALARDHDPTGGFIFAVPAGFFALVGIRIAAIRRQIEVDPALGEVRACWGLFVPRMFVRRTPSHTFNGVHVRSFLVVRRHGVRYPNYEIELLSAFRSPTHVRNFMTYAEAGASARQLAAALEVEVTEDVSSEHVALETT